MLALAVPTVALEGPALFTWPLFGLGLIEALPEFEADIPGATCTREEPLLVRSDFRLACLGVELLALLGNKIDDEAKEVRGDWFGV